LREIIFTLTRMLAVVVLVVFAEGAQAAAVMTGTQAWPDGKVPYRIDADLLAQAGAAGADCGGWEKWRVGPARQACRSMAEWTRHSGVRFIGNSRALDAVHIRKADATTATIGRLPVGNRVNIEPGASYGSVLHEFGHVLGLMHEHQRADRDLYIRLEPFLGGLLERCTFLNDVCRDVRLSFPRLGTKASTDYDPCSLMHYLANQAPRHPQDKRWARIFTLTDKGRAALRTCVARFGDLPERCRKVGQKCVISEQDAALVRRFNGVPPPAPPRPSAKATPPSR